MKTYTIYKATNLKNGMAYIGRTSCALNKRRSWHHSNARKYNSKFARALKEFKRDDFRWEQIATTTSKEESYLLEEEYIKEYCTIEKGYNEKPGDKVPWNKGKIMSERYCENLRGKNNPMYGKTQSEQTRAKLSERMKKCQLGKSNHAAKRVYCIELDRYWDTVKECSVELGIHKDSISHNCRGVNKSAGGFRFKYV